MREVPLPSGFEGLAGRVRYVHRSTATEYSSSCPVCGGDIHKNGDWPDRFRMFIVGKQRAWCRKCSYIWFPDAADPDFRPDPALIAQWQAERERQYVQQKITAERALELLEKERRWLEWHDSMDEQARVMWESAGIPRDWQDFWKLGYTSSKQFENGGEMFVRASMTIPKFDFGWHVRNVDFRIIDPPPGVGKYRPIANIPATAYITTPQLDGFHDEVFVCEGSKKAMVVSIRTGEEQRQVVGVPSCTSWAGMDERLRDCGRVWVMFDPDATKWAFKFGESVGKNARIVEMPHKADDAILKYGMTNEMFRTQLRQAVKAV